MLRPITLLILSLTLLSSCDKTSALKELSDSLTIEDHMTPASTDQPQPPKAPDYDQLIDKFDRAISNGNFNIEDLNLAMLDENTTAERYHYKEDKNFTLQDDGPNYSMSTETQQYNIANYPIHLLIITNLNTNKRLIKLSLNRELCFPISKLKERYFKNTTPHVAIFGLGSLRYTKKFSNWKLEMTTRMYTDDDEYLTARKLNDPAMHQECAEYLEFDQDIFAQ